MVLQNNPNEETTPALRKLIADQKIAELRGEIRAAEEAEDWNKSSELREEIHQVRARFRDEEWLATLSPEDRATELASRERVEPLPRLVASEESNGISTGRNRSLSFQKKSSMRWLAKPPIWRTAQDPVRRLTTISLLPQPAFLCPGSPRERPISATQDIDRAMRSVI
jgi:hypothetical protein